MTGRMWLGLMALVTACGGDGLTSVGNATVPRVGQYSYRATGVFGVSGAPIVGTLRLTFASRDSIAGTWSVPEYQSPGLLGSYNIDAYVLWAKNTSGSISVTHRIARSGNSITCLGKIALGSGFPCELTYVGP
jgi:hypothetical protein